MYKSSDTHESQNEFKGMNPALTMIVRSIERVRDTDGPDRVIINNNSKGSITVLERQGGIPEISSVQARTHCKPVRKTHNGRWRP